MIFDIFGRFATKEDMLDLNLRLARLEQAQKNKTPEAKDPEESVKQLRRILENYIPGRISYQSCDGDAKIVGLAYTFNPHYTYIYKDGREYEITGLSLNNPEFEVLNSNNVICALDIVKNTVVEYVIDLNNCTVVKTSEG